MNQTQIELFRRAVDLQIGLFDATCELNLQLADERFNEILEAVSAFGTVYDEGDEIPDSEVRTVIRDLQRANSESNPAG